MSDNSLLNEVNNITVSSLPRYIAYSINAKRPACFWSRPGVGKSAIMAKVAKMLGYHMEDIRLSQIESIDLRGAPTKNYLTIELDEENNIMDKDLRNAKQEKNKGIPIIEWAMPDFLVRAREKALKGIPTLFFFDELNHGDETTQAPAYQFILDNKIGCFSLGENDRVFAACNYENEGSIANPMSLALANRMAHFYIDADPKSFLRHARDSSFHPMLISAVQENPTLIYLFPSDEGMSKNKSFSTPRTLEYASDYLYQILDNQQGAIDMITRNLDVDAGDDEDTIAFQKLMLADMLPSDDEIEYDLMVALSGCLGMVAAQNIMNFIRIGKDLPSADHILSGNHDVFKNGVDFKRTDIQALLSNQSLNRLNNEYKELLALHKKHDKKRISFGTSGVEELEKAKKVFYTRYENFVVFAKNNFNSDLFVLAVVTRLIREMKIQPLKPYFNSADTMPMMRAEIDRVSQESFH